MAWLTSTANVKLPLYIRWQLQLNSSQIWSITCKAWSSSPPGLDAAMMEIRGLCRSQAVSPACLQSSPRSWGHGHGKEKEAEGPLPALASSSLKSLTFCLVLISLITLKTGTINIQLCNCCRLKEESNTSFLSADAPHAEYTQDSNYKNENSSG